MLSTANQTFTGVLFPYYLKFPTTWWGMNYYLNFREGETEAQRAQRVLLWIMLLIMLHRDGI